MEAANAGTEFMRAFLYVARSVARFLVMAVYICLSKLNGVHILI